MKHSDLDLLVNQINVFLMKFIEKKQQQLYDDAAVIMKAWSDNSISNFDRIRSLESHMQWQLVTVYNYHMSYSN